jgi:hypothetical protein
MSWRVIQWALSKAAVPAPADGADVRSEHTASGASALAPNAASARRLVMRLSTIGVLSVSLTLLAA